MSLLNPWVLLGIVMAVLSAFGGGYYKGKDAEYQRQQLEIAALNAKARETEQAMSKVAQTYGETLRKANNAAKLKETKLRADLAAGTLSLRIPVKAPTCPAVQATGDAPTTSGSDAGTASAELDRSTADALIAITAEGDAAIRKLNTCIQTYEQLRNMK
jgi:Bacteriophage Rz lysis protein